MQMWSLAAVSKKKAKAATAVALDHVRPLLLGHLTMDGVLASHLTLAGGRVGGRYAMLHLDSTL